MMTIEYQNMYEFLETPFGSTNSKKNELEMVYQKLKRDKKINVVSILELDSSYFIHVNIPSETHVDTFYDVVIQLFIDVKHKDLIPIYNYYAKFFSNSPSFVYKYAMLYKTNGYLIESLDVKLDQMFLNVAPSKSNSTLEMTYDKSLYVVCRYLIDNKYTYLTKLGMSIKKTRNVSKFIERIKDFETIQLLSNTSSIEKSIKKELSDDKAEIKVKKEPSNKGSIHRSISVKKPQTKKRPQSKNKKVTGKSSTTKVK